MRRFTVILSVVTVMLLSHLAPGAQPRAVAQEATPAADTAMPGFTFVPLALALGVEVPSPTDLVMAQIRVDPGVTLPLEASDLQGGTLILASGTFTMHVDTDWTITRAASLKSAIATANTGDTVTPATEVIASGDEASLERGDTAYIPGRFTGEMRNDGQEPAVATAILLGPDAARMTEATPVP